MDVLEVTQRYPPAIGGVEDHVYRLSAHLRRLGVRVTVETTDLERDRPFRRLGRESPREPGVHRSTALPWFPAPHGLGTHAPGLYRAVVGAAPGTIVHAHAFGYAPTWAGALRRRLGRAPLVVTPHSDAGRGSRASRVYATAVAKYTVRAADRVVALTELERSHLRGLGVDDDRIVVLPNGIDLEEFSRPDSVPRGTGEFRILFVGRLYAVQKGLVPLVQALARLGGAWQLRLIGEDWGGLSVVRGLAAKSGILDRIALLGAVPRAVLLEEYARADVLVLPSLFEPFGIVLLEAMASGLPVIGTRVGGIPEILEDGASGLLVPPGDPETLAAALRRLRADPGEARQIAARGRNRVERYSWTALAPRFVELFESLGA